MDKKCAHEGSEQKLAFVTNEHLERKFEYFQWKIALIQNRFPTKFHSPAPCFSHAELQFKSL